MYRRSKVSEAVILAISAGAIGGNGSSAAGHRGSRRNGNQTEESLQDVPIAVIALTGETMEELGIANFSDYVLQLPGVTAGGSGPGQNTIYIRGVASTTPNLTVAGVAGLAPNVAFYLDEQPLAQPGRNLDVYAADLQRIEVLSGPQGTLFGSSSQAGNVRLITNKPDPAEMYGKVKVGAARFPMATPARISSSCSICPSVRRSRCVAFSTTTREAAGSTMSRERGMPARAHVFARLARYETTECRSVSNGKGFRQASTSGGVTFLEADNSSLVEENFNETTYTGGRISALWDVNDNWSLLVAHQSQDVDSDGVFLSDPDLGDLAVERFSPDSFDDTFDNTSWTLTGLLGELEVVYTGAFTDRETARSSTTRTTSSSVSTCRTISATITLPTRAFSPTGYRTEPASRPTCSLTAIPGSKRFRTSSGSRRTSRGRFA